MFICLENVMDATRLTAITDQIKANPQSFESGSASAGWQARAVKHNEQATGAMASAVGEMVVNCLLAHPVFQAAAQPKQIIRTMVSRYQEGMHYGTHVDDALMAGLRTDLSFTLFLNDPSTYDGGALVIEASDGDNEIKLGAGSLVLYPAGTLHRVQQVTRGERLAVVGWVRSYIRSAEDREILFDLENTITILRSQKADRNILDHMLKLRANLMRKWAED
jgi:PKHD-type hydroxylase